MLSLGVGSCQTYRSPSLLGFPEARASTLPHWPLPYLEEGEACHKYLITTKALGRAAPTATTA